MEKMKYVSPEMEIIRLKNKVAILAGSEGSETGGGGLGGED